MTQKMAKKDEFTRVTLADIAREMAKPRLAKSVRSAVEAAEEEDSRIRPLHSPRGRREN
jgi:hypothetical protein